MADLNPVKGSEQSGIRPVAILSGNALNDHMPVVIVAPFSSKVKKFKGNPIVLPTKSNGLKSTSELLLFQIKAIDKERLMKKVGSIDNDILIESIKTINDIFKY